VGVRGFLEFRGGVLHIWDTEKPEIVITRSDRPVAYWSFVAFFYSILIGMIIAAALAQKFPS
jgi:hypothetical protein